MIYSCGQLELHIFVGMRYGVAIDFSTEKRWILAYSNHNCCPTRGIWLSFAFCTLLPVTPVTPVTRTGYTGYAYRCNRLRLPARVRFS